MSRDAKGPFAEVSTGFLEDFHHSAQFGATAAQGVDRQAGTPEHGAVRDWFEGRAKDFGFTVRTDQIGNIFALKEWVEGAPFVLVGSHLDSQPLGGRFDGTYGVIAALHAAHIVDEQVNSGTLVPQFNIAVVDWFNEEGARFAPSIMGSSVFTGRLPLETALKTTDPGGVTVAEALEETGRLGDKLDLVASAHAEIHIEQGRRLERAGLSIAAVDRSWYTQKLLVRVVGEQSHTGATIMADRRDALLGASQAVIAAEEVVRDFEPERLITSVGQFDVTPNSPIVVPSRVDLVVDLRADQQEDVEAARSKLLEKFQSIATARNLTITTEDFDVRKIQEFPRESVELVEKAARDEGHESVALATMAGHDSVPLNLVVPSVMMFIPSVDGISHCEREFTTDEDMLTGLKVLCNVVSRLVAGEFQGVEPGDER